jgi:hypothetical protein
MHTVTITRTTGQRPVDPALGPVAHHRDPDGNERPRLDIRGTGISDRAVATAGL